LRSAEESNNFIVRYLWTAFVFLLVIGGLLVALSRNDFDRNEIEGATLAGHSGPWIR
jgi:hypothetical protein